MNNITVMNWLFYMVDGNCACLDIKTVFPGLGILDLEDEMVMIQSYLDNGNFYMLAKQYSETFIMELGKSH